MDYISVKEAVQKREISERRIQKLCEKQDKQHTKIRAFLDDSKNGGKTHGFTKKALE